MPSKDRINICASLCVSERIRLCPHGAEKSRERRVGGWGPGGGGTEASGVRNRGR